MTPRSYIHLLAPVLADPPDLSAVHDEESWKLIRKHAGRYGVAPLVAYAARPHVSPAERVWCDRVLIDSWRRHESTLRHLEYLLSLFASEGIATIALKGPLLARRYYDPPFLRKPSLDIDLGVGEADLERACRALAGIGYALDLPLSYAREHSHHVELSHASRPHVELHFRLSHRALGIPVSEFFDRAATCCLPSGQNALVLGPADQLLHLVLHLSQSRFGTLFHLCEIRRVCKAEPVEVRAEAVRLAARYHYCGAFRVMDIAFRTRWNESFLPPGHPLPKTWLDWRLTPALYHRFENWSLPGRQLSVAQRIWARWLDFQLTDRPADALRLALFFAKTAGFSITMKNAWGGTKRLRFAPDVPDENTEAVRAPDDSVQPARSKQVG